MIDRRGRGGGLAVGGGLAGILGLIFYLLTGNSPDVLAPADRGFDEGTGGSGYVGTPEEERLKDFVSVILADTEDTWPGLLSPLGVDYREPQLVLFTGGVRSACGSASSAVGPFYCPADHQVYLDLSFFEELQRMGGAGDFAQAYVVAHEIGHHVQNLLGISGRAQAAQRQLGGARANEVSVRVELQADCFAGVWAHHAQKQRQVLEPGDVEEGLGAAAAIGDDQLQKQAQGYVVPESFTHGSSRQRMEWFSRGLKSGTLEACDTFRR